MSTLVLACDWPDGCRVVCHTSSDPLPSSIATFCFTGAGARSRFVHNVLKGEGGRLYLCGLLCACEDATSSADTRHCLAVVSASPFVLGAQVREYLCATVRLYCSDAAARAKCPTRRPLSRRGSDGADAETSAGSGELSAAFSEPSERISAGLSARTESRASRRRRISRAADASATSPPRTPSLRAWLQRRIDARHLDLLPPAPPPSVPRVVTEGPSCAEAWRAASAAAALRLCGPALLAELHTAALAERSIVFVGADTLSLVAIADAVSASISPLVWEGGYLPVVPDALADMLGAPVPSIFGLCAPEEEQPAVVARIAREYAHLVCARVPPAVGADADAAAALAFRPTPALSAPPPSLRRPLIRALGAVAAEVSAGVSDDVSAGISAEIGAEWYADTTAIAVGVDVLRALAEATAPLCRALEALADRHVAGGDHVAPPLLDAAAFARHCAGALSAGRGARRWCAEVGAAQHAADFYGRHAEREGSDLADAAGVDAARRRADVAAAQARRRRRSLSRSEVDEEETARPWRERRRRPPVGAAAS